MAADLTHFAINADDVEATRTFYERVFEWEFEAWGPPGFYRIRTGGGDGAVGGALQERRELIDGVPMRGFECSFAGPDGTAVAERVRRAGGRGVMELFTIDGVGDLMAFSDVSGNVFLAIQYVPGTI